jgi:hypothetical protein
LEGALNLQLFEQAFQAIIARHQILTTTIVVFDDEPKQRLNSTMELTLQMFDLSNIEDNEEKARELANREAIAPFDLETGPLFRALLIKLSPTRHVFILTMHHIIADGWSLGILMTELSALYSSYQKGTEPSLPPLPIHYQDFVAWQSRRLASEALAEDRNYWLNELSGNLPALELGTDYPRPKVRTFNGEVVHFTIEKNLTRLLYLFSRDYDATLFMTLLSGLYALFYRYTGQSDIILGTPISGRTHKDLEGQIGLYLNLLPLRVAVHGEDSFAELLDHVRDVTLSGYEHQAYPFASLIKELNFERDPARPPLISAGLTLQNLNPSTSATGDELGFKVSHFSQELKTSEYDLWFLFSEKDDELTANVNYNTDIFRRETIELIWSRLVSVFVQVTDDPARKIMDLEMSEDSSVIPQQIHELAIELNV